MPAAIPDSLLGGQSAGVGGMAAGTMFQSSLSSSAAAPSAGGIIVGGNANLCVAALVAGGLLVLLVTHLLGFRFGFDVSVGR